MKSNSSYLLRQVRVLDPATHTDRIADVLIVKGKIEALETSIPVVPDETELVEAQGAILAPGLCDLYSYSGEPGHEERETLASLAAAATAGGFTRLAILPQTDPPLDNPATVASLFEKATLLREEASSPRFYLWGSLTVEAVGKQMAELAGLAAANVIGFTDGRSLENLNLLRRLLEYVQPLGKPVALVPVNEGLKGNGVMREGAASIALGLPGNPALAETTAIASLLELVAEIGTPVHLMRISTRRGVELIAAAKARGLPITASTTWMHLLLNTQALHSYDPNLRLEPPLGNEADRVALAQGVKQGILDAIAIDHAAYPYEEKTVPFAEAPPGAIGLELALPLLWQHFVESGQWSALELWKALSTSPQACLQQPLAHCAPGQVAEVILFDPHQHWTVNPHTLHSLGQNTPWLGKEIRGRVIRFLDCF